MEKEKIPNKDTLEAMNEIQEMLNDPSTKFYTLEETFEILDEDEEV